MPRADRAGRAAKVAGYLLLAAGGLLVLACLPGWFWLALLGAALVTAGWYMVGVKR